MQIKNKFLIILIFLVLIFSILSLRSKVSALTINYNNNDVVLPDYESLLEKHNADCAIIFYHKVKNYYELYILKSHDSTDFYSIIPRYNSPSYIISPYYEYHLNSSSNSWDYYHYCDNLYGSGISVGNNSNYEIVYSNFDIKNKDGDVVFRKPVLTLGEVLEKNNPVQMFQTMTRGIITYLIVFLIGLVAFWKAWQLLLKELRKA